MKDTPTFRMGLLGVGLYSTRSLRLNGHYTTHVLLGRDSS